MVTKRIHVKGTGTLTEFFAGTREPSSNAT